jgi:hypothetical protein
MVESSYNCDKDFEKSSSACLCAATHVLVFPGQAVPMWAKIANEVALDLPHPSGADILPCRDCGTYSRYGG